MLSKSTVVTIHMPSSKGFGCDKATSLARVRDTGREERAPMCGHVNRVTYALCNAPLDLMSVIFPT